MTDLDDAVVAFRTAANATPEDRAGHGDSLHQLAIALRLRFEEAGALADMNEAVNLAETAVGAAPPGHQSRPRRLAGLGAALLTRHGRTRSPNDLDAAIRAFDLAAASTPASHRHQVPYLNNRGVALWARFRAAREPRDLSAAIEAFETTLAAIPADRPDRVVHVVNLGLALHSRFDLAGDPADLDAAIGHLRAALDSTPAGDPHHGRVLHNLARLLQARAAHASEPADRAAAVAAYEAAAGSTTAAPSARVRAAVEAAALAGSSEPGRAAAILEGAVRLLPDVAPRHLRSSDQHYALRRVAGLAADAAALVLTASGRAEHALRLLEAGRAVLLSQALDTRSDHTDLRERHPDLAARYERLRDLLDRPQTDSPQGRLRPTDEFAATVAEIRAQDGFATFNLPPTADELLAETALGSIVVFNVSRYRSDALLLTAGGVTALELPDLSHDALLGRIDAFYRALRASSDQLANPAARRNAQAELNDILAWLWDSAAEPVLRALGHTAPPGPHDEWPRVWWLPGGLLGLLPLHAAGHHNPPDGDWHDTVMDRVISSYTPTIRALSHARRRPPAAADALRALIVAMPTTPQVAGRLRHVQAEAEMLRTYLFHPVLLTEPAPGTAPTAPLPTKANVLSRLAACPIAHFACHGANDPADPSRSRLLLHDHDSDPLTVASLAPVRLDHVQLAYLSACGTAVTDTIDLADEAIHLTSAFQLAGYPHVIGTLWEIDDMVAVEVAEHFYQALQSDRHTPDVSRSAHALHQAIRATRNKYPALPSLWAAYLHAGA